MKGFEKCCISSAVDGTGGDMTCCGMAVCLTRSDCEGI